MSNLLLSLPLTRCAILVQKHTLCRVLSGLVQTCQPQKDYIWFIPLLSLVYQRAQWYRGMKAHINLRQEPLTKILYKKTNFKKVGFSTMAFTAKILSWRFRHLNIVGCLLKRRPTKGGSRAPQDSPPSYAPGRHNYLSFSN